MFITKILTNIGSFRIATMNVLAPPLKDRYIYVCVYVYMYVCICVFIYI